MAFRSRSIKLLAWTGACLLLLAAGLAGRAWLNRQGRIQLEFRITQALDQILFSEHGEPPQFAIWLEDPLTRRSRTIFVTRRAGTGDWEGKAECPDALPRWFRVFQQESGMEGLPRPGRTAPAAVTQATPKGDRFAWAVEVPQGSRWICWLEVNLAADYNPAFPALDEETGREDTHHDGQPSLLYRGEITAKEGARLVPEIHGYTLPGMAGKLQVDLAPIGTARRIFTAVEILAVPPPMKLF